MTITERPTGGPELFGDDQANASRRPGPPYVRARWSLDGRRVVLLTGLFAVALVISLAVVLYGVGSLINARDQRRLMSAERAAITHAALQQDGLYHHTLPTAPPVPGAPVAVLAVPSLGLQEAVVEGVAPAETIAGPGHVPGTAGVGQPGNSAIVGRRAGYGGVFGRLGQLRPGDRIITATIEGESLYVVKSVRTENLITRPTAASQPSALSAAGPKSGTTKKLPTHAHQATTVATGNVRSLYGPTAHNQLTLVTSSSGPPWNTNEAVVVIARMRGQAFTPTPQESRSPNELGTGGDPTALPWFFLALFGFAATLVAARALYRTCTARTAYLLTTAPMLVLAVLAPGAASRLLPAWT